MVTELQEISDKLATLVQSVDADAVAEAALVNTPADPETV